jgi:hypothetical protein
LRLLKGVVLVPLPELVIGLVDHDEQGRGRN